MAIQFNSIPGAGLVAPIFSFEVNSGGQYTVSNRFIIAGYKTSAGTLAANTLLPVPTGAQQIVDSLAGPGSMLREMYRIVCQNIDPGPQVWLLPLDDTGLTAEVRTITIGAAAIVAGVGVFEICGEQIQIAIVSTDTVTTIAAKVAAAINGYYNSLTNAMLPMTATSALGVVTVTMRNKGVWGSEVDIFVDPKIINNVFAISTAWTVATTTAGAGTPSGIATALAALADDPADFIVCPFSDATSLAAFSAATNDIAGRWSWSRQSYGHVWSASVGAFSALTTLGLTLNDRHTSLLGCISPGSSGTPHGSWLWTAAFAARVAAWLCDIITGNVSRAHKGLVVQGLRPPRDRSVWPNYSARNTLLQSGVSTWGVGADGSVQIDKIITTYRTGAAGQPDAVFRDVQSMYQLSGGLGFMRAGFGTLYGNKAIAPSNPGNLGAIVTPADITGGAINLYVQLCKQGVFADAAIFASAITVAINAGNPNRVDLFLPMERVNPLDILASNATIYQQYPSSLT